MPSGWIGCGMRREMLTATVDDVMSWEPCYDEKTGAYGREYVERLFDGRERMSALEFLQLDIPIEDRFWAVLRDELLDERTLRLWATDCAEQVLPLYESHRPGDDRPRKAIEAARGYARGLISLEKMAAARTDAWATEWVPALATTREAAWEAAFCAAREAVREAALAASQDSSRDTAWDTAWSYARKWQLDRLVAYLRDEVEQ